METLRPLPSPDLRCALCHDALAEERVACDRCGTALHEDCAHELERCPTLACPAELVPWRFEEAMERRDGALVRSGAAVGAALGAILGACLAVAGAAWPEGARAAARLLHTVATMGLLGAAQGVALTIFLLFLVRAATTGTPPLRP